MNENGLIKSLFMEILHCLEVNMKNTFETLYQQCTTKTKGKILASKLPMKCVSKHHLF